MSVRPRGISSGDLVWLLAASNKECFGNPCGGRGVSPHLNASSQHLILGLLMPFAGSFRCQMYGHDYGLDVVSDAVLDVVPHLHGHGSKPMVPYLGG